MARRRFSFFMPPLDHSFIRWMDDLYRGLFTPSGRVLLIGGLAPAAVVLLGGLVVPMLEKFPRVARGEDRLLVYPRFTPLESFDVPHGRDYQPGGISVASRVGESTEFFGTRDYREGDRQRDIHWASFARTGKLIVKE